MILHISGLFTHWQVHMVCFSETHPDPASQIYSDASLWPPPGSAVPASDVRGSCDPPQNVTKVLQGRVGCIPYAVLLFTCAWVDSEAEAAEVHSPLTSLTQHFCQWPCDEGQPADAMQAERVTKAFRLKSSSESWPEVQPQSKSNMNGLLAFVPGLCICDDGTGTSEDDEFRNIWIFWMRCATLWIYNSFSLINCLETTVS